MHRASAFTVLVFALLLALPCHAAPALFGALEFRVGDLDTIPQWDGVLARARAEAGAMAACRARRASCPSRSAAEWADLLARLEPLPRFVQMQQINGFVNRWRYISDQQNYHRRDVWATPFEFMKRSGDCEDYSIMKYFSLRMLGFAPDELRLVVLRDQLRGVAHAVLAVYLDDEIYILDNLSGVTATQDALPQYLPYYALNETARWVYAPKDAIVVSSMAGAAP